MHCTAKYIPYSDTGRFNNLVIDYINGDAALNDFISERPTVEGIRRVIEVRKKYPVNRLLLHKTLIEQYVKVDADKSVVSNIELLRSENTFTICTAHQPNIFTGPLYFIYKILHVVKLASYLKQEMPLYDFVPVYYMGSEDADLEELGHIYVNGKKYEWQTSQKGAVGRMIVDEGLLMLIQDIKGQLLVEPFGKEITELIQNCYIKGTTIEESTFRFVHSLFGRFGLVVLLPDNASLKKEFGDIIRKELTEQFSTREVAKTLSTFPVKYHVQAEGRDINLFYLEGESRDRIVKTQKGFVAGKMQFTEQELLEMLKEYPERFSPNVILRPVYQEMILPNVVFIGGGGELGYWLELKNLFLTLSVPMPVLVLRNSFMLLRKEQVERIIKLSLAHQDLFKPANELLKQLILSQSKLDLKLENESAQLVNVYNTVQKRASVVDPTLDKHVQHLRQSALNRIQALENKMFKSEKKKFAASERQLKKLYDQLFPSDGLQERHDNLLAYYSQWGESLLDNILLQSDALEQQFCILSET